MSQPQADQPAPDPTDDATAQDIPAQKSDEALQPSSAGQADQSNPPRKRLTPEEREALEKKYEEWQAAPQPVQPHEQQLQRPFPGGLFPLFMVFMVPYAICLYLAQGSRGRPEFRLVAHGGAAAFAVALICSVIGPIANYPALFAFGHWAALGTVVLSTIVALLGLGLRFSSSKSLPDGPKTLRELPSDDEF